jgi:hypothetical protein
MFVRQSTEEFTAEEVCYESQLTQHELTRAQENDSSKYPVSAFSTEEHWREQRMETPSIQTCGDQLISLN